MRTISAAVILLLVSCSTEAAPGSDVSPPDASDEGVRTTVERLLDDAIEQTSALTDSIDAILQPVALLTPSQEAALRQHGNAAQLARARQLGARPADRAELAAYRANGRLVELEDSTALWAVRELEHSLPLVTPDAHALLTRIAEEFQQRITALGLPPYRVEVTSVLRTASSQEDLRQTNVNAAAGTSTHEFGTTLDIAYSSFAAPLELPDRDMSGAPWLVSRVDWFIRGSLEAAAARKARELQAILGGVLLELQQAGDVMVTLERQQPVYHLTVSRAQPR